MVILIFFQHRTSDEALAREACMIDAMGECLVATYIFKNCIAMSTELIGIHLSYAIYTDIHSITVSP